jgi:glycosyltransferase involved in cell wall biosynthesis
MDKNYTVYSSAISMKPDSAHEIHDVMCANAAANMGYPTLLIYPNYEEASSNFLDWINTYKPVEPDRKFIDFFNIEKQLKTVKLPIPWFSLKYKKNRWINPSIFIYKYYFPYHILPHTKVIHTRDWNCVKTAVRYRIPVIYERHYFQETPVEAAIAESPYLKIAITQSPPIQESLIKAGMPADKTVWMHNGFSPNFVVRQPEEAKICREELLKNGRKYLVVYSGALYPFKGVDMLIDVAKELPDIQFACTGGTEEQVQHYKNLARDKQVENINFLGWILPRSRLISIMQAADILAHPHSSGKSADFTNPLKFFQYLAAGTPLVITEILPLMEFKSAPIAANWCPPDDPIAFAQTITKTLQQYPRKEEGYLENVDYAYQFTYEKRTEKILQFINLTMLT